MLTLPTLVARKGLPAPGEDNGLFGGFRLATGGGQAGERLDFARPLPGRPGADRRGDHRQRR
ncbi:hypothetical protein ACWED2_43285 [Amycolatopsis sp. NPDC005003]